MVRGPAQVVLNMILETCVTLISSCPVVILSVELVLC